MKRKNILLILMIAIIALGAPLSGWGQSTLTIPSSGITGATYSTTGTDSSNGSSDQGKGSPMANTYREYSVTQFLYTSTEMGDAKTLKSISFYHNANSFSSDIYIYLKETDDADTYNYTASTSSGATLVYSATNATIGASSAGWQTFSFDADFNYSGTKNLLVIVVRGGNTAHGWTQNQAWYYTTTSFYSFRFKYSDTQSNVDLSSTSGYTSNCLQRPVVQFTYIPTYTVTYNANGGSGTMTDPNSPYASGSTVTVLDNGFTAPSGKTFSKWNTQSGGGGTDYNPGGTFSISGNTTLYAQWVDDCPTQSVPFSENFNSSSSLPSCWTQEYDSHNLNWTIASNSTYGTGSNAAKLSNSSSGGDYTTKLITPKLNLNSYSSATLTFKHTQVSWGSDQDQLCIYYRTSPSNSWVQLGSCYTNSITATGTTETFTLPAAACTSTCQIAFEGHANYGRGVYVDDVSVTPSYSVTYNANGATSGSVPTDNNSPYTSGATVTVLGNTGNLAKTGYTFSGWNTAADGSGTSYSPNDTFTILANTTLYAQWAVASSCEFSYTLNDAYGDGYNGNKIKVVNASTNAVLEELTLSDGSLENGTFSVPSGTTINFVWEGTSWAHECGYAITAPNGVLLIYHKGCEDSDDCTAPSGTLLSNYTTDCSCNAYSFPYTYGFEDASDFNCWTTVDCESDVAQGFSGIVSGSAHSGNKLFSISSFNGDTAPQYLISPELTGVVNGVHVEFYYRIVDYSNNAPESFQVGYSTTDNNVSSFTWSNSYTCTSATYEHFTANYTGRVKYVAVKYTTQNSYYLMLDDFSITEIPSCLEPTNVNATSITTTSATIGWTAGGSETSWDLYYTDNASDVPTASTTPSISAISTNSRNLTGLTPATTYYVYVRAVCSSSDKSVWSPVYTFHTECNAMSLPYSENFESGALTVCWNAINDNPVYMGVSVGNTSAYSGTYHLDLDRRTSNGNQIVVLPEVASNYALSGYEVSFYARLYAANSNQTTTNRNLVVGVMTDPDDASTFVQVGNAVTPTDSYAQYIFDLSGYSGSGHYIAIKHTSSSNGHTFIDNLEVNPITYTLSWSDPTGGTISVTQNGSSVSTGSRWPSGTQFNITATASTGYSFSGWTATSGSTLGNTSNASTTLTMGAVNTTLTATFTPIPYTISTSVSPSGAGTVSGGGSYNYSTTCTLTATANDGYFFVRWEKNGSQVSTDNPYSFTVSEAGTYTAVFVALPTPTVMTCGQTYSGTLGTSGIWDSYTSCGYSEPGEEHVYAFTPATTATYTFTATTTTGDPDFFLMNSLSNTGTNLIDDCWGNGNQTLQLTAGTTYYVIADNYKDSQTSGYTLSVSCAKYTLTFSAGTGGSVTVRNNGSSVSSGDVFEEGTVLDITATPNSGYAFSGWTVTGTGASVASTAAPVTTFTMGSAACTLTANFVNAQSIPYTETFDSNGWTEVNGSATNKWYRGSLGAHEGSYGYYISNDGGTTNEYTSSNDARSVVYIYKNVYFPEAGTYSLSFDLRQKGESTFDCVGAMLYSSSTTPSAVAGSYPDSGLTTWPSGYSVMIGGAGATLSGGEWKRASFTFDVSSAGIYKLTLAWKNDHSVTNQPPASIDNVYLTKTSPLTITANPSGSGSVSVTQNGTAVSSGASVGQGETLNITATPASGYKFNGWTVSGSGASVADANSRTTTFTMGSEATTLTANFVEWTVDIVTSPASTECLSSGTEVTMTASSDIPFEYSFTKTSSTFSSISGSPDGTYSTTGDGVTYQISLPFAFNLAGKDFAANTTLYMRCDGHVSFGSEWSDHYASSPGTSRSVIAVLGYDQYLDSDAKMYYKVTTEGGVQVLILEWNYMRSYSSSYNRAYYQVKLYQGSNIVKMCYGSFSYGVSKTMYTYITADGNMTKVTSSYANPVIETNTTATTTGITVSSAELAPANGTVYTFTPPVITYAWSYTGTAGTANNNVYTASPTTNSSYTVNVTYNGATKSETVDVTLIPAAPTNLQYSNVTAISATVSWNANGASNWQYSIDGGTTWTPTSTASANLTGLSPGTAYTFQVKAVNGSCESSAASVSFTTLSNYIITTAASPAAGGSVSGGGSYAPGSTVTLTATPTSNWIFYKWSDGTNTYTANPLTFTASATATYTAYFAPLKINDETDWGYFADAVGNGCTYSTETVTLEDNISVSTTVGTSKANSFQGTFDGQCHTLEFTKTGVTTQLCAPFMQIQNATIQNLHTTGTISTSHQMAAGIAGRAYGACNFTNCRSSMEINTSRSGDGTNGGLLAVLNDLDVSGSSRAVFTGCVFDGKLKSTSNTTNNGGFVGTSHYNYVDFTNCLFCPSEVANMSGGQTCTFSRPDGTYNSRYFTFNNCYYTETLGTAQGKQAYILDMVASPAAGGTVSHSASGTEYGCNGITAYTTGLAYDIDSDATDELILGDGESASITASANSGYTFMNWIDGSSTPINNPYTVTMGAADRTVTANFVDQMAGGNGGSDCVGISQDSETYGADGTENMSTLYGHTPFVPYFRYGYQQIVYPGEDLPSTINSISFKYKGTSGLTRLFDIYMAETTENFLSDWMSSASLTLVYEGSTSYTFSGNGEWNEITLTTPFSHTSGKNIVLVIYDKTGTDEGFHYQKYFYSATSSYNVHKWAATDTESYINTTGPTIADNDYVKTYSGAQYPIIKFCSATGPDNWVTAVTSEPLGYSESGSTVTISNEEGLAWLISKVNGLNSQSPSTFETSTITLTADVDMSAHTWVPIGTAEENFSGTFEGNGHVIKGITRSEEFPHNGLFGYVSGTANIKDVVVEASLTGNSIATGAVVGTYDGTGTISNAEGAGTLTGGALTTAIGGLVGNMTDGSIHSSFAVATLTGGASSTQMGGLVGINAGDLYNSYSNATYAGTSATKGGLVGANTGTVENCYAAGIVSGVSALAGSNSGGTIQYCYADAVGAGYVGTNATAPSGCGTYGAVQSSIKHLNYMYRDNLITKSTNTYVGSNDAIADGISVYVNNHIPVWNGLVSALNQWVRANPRSISGLSSWHRPLTTNINGDLPVLAFPMDNSLGTLDADGKFLQYGSNQNGGNGLDAVLATYYNTTASIFHYGKATSVTRVPTANVKVTVAEDAVLLQASGASAFRATVGVTFDNSDHGQHAYDYWGNKLNYDWHLLSTPLYRPLTGAVHSTDQPSGNPWSNVDITNIGGYFPNGLITNDNPAVGGSIKWDFYTYYEPQYHWINLKRNKNNHYHQDSPNDIIIYNEPDQDTDGESAYYIPGKGYEMAINQDTYMNATGTLNRGDVPITLTNQEPASEQYAKGWNLVGNPYQAYLDIDEIGYDPIYTYDADQGTFVPYTKTASVNPAIVSEFIHPHQAFFVHAKTGETTETLTFTQDMATTSSEAGSYFREKNNYPLVNLFADDDVGHRDLTVIEFHRPELGGAPKLDYMRTAPFNLAAHYAGTSYGIFFATDDIERVPVKFKPSDNGLITLTWSTHNGEFRKLLLIDNKLGVEHNMLADNSYTFEASPDDYSSRFYIVYDCSGMGIEENEDDGGASTGSATFAYISHGNIVIDVGTSHGASLQIIDVLGRVLYSKVIAGTEGTYTVSTRGLAKGVYLIRLADGHNVKTQKLVVQ